MARPPIPVRIPPLQWRKPALLWTPLALALALGGAYAGFGAQGALANAVLITGAFTFALALTTLGAAWYFGRAPRSHREVVLHVLAAGLAVALAAPVLLTQLLAAAAEQAAGQAFSLPMALSVTPLAIVLGLPVAMLAGIVFSLIALERPPAKRRLTRAEREQARYAYQPFD